MRIALINDFADHGGAAIAANNLRSGLTRIGHATARVSWYAPHTSSSPDSNSISLESPALHRIPRGVRALSARLHHPFELWAWQKLTRTLKRLRPDIISLHNCSAGPWSWNLPTRLQAIAPVVWTLHDAWSFTGRCYYFRDCRRFQSQCDQHCPTLGEFPRLAPGDVRRAHTSKRRNLEPSASLIAVSPSQWLRDVAISGGWDPTRIRNIPNSVAIPPRESLDRRAARSTWKLVPEAKVISVMAADLSNRDKGGDILPDVLCQLAARPDFTVIVAGHRDENLPRSDNMIHVGYLRQQTDIHRFFSAANVNLHLASQDNFPNTILEAAACGTPTIGFKTTGVSEMLAAIPASIGVPFGDVASMVGELDRFFEIELPESQPAGVPATHTYTRDHHQRESQAHAYTEVFDELLAARA